MRLALRGPIDNLRKNTGRNIKRDLGRHTLDLHREKGKEGSPIRRGRKVKAEIQRVETSVNAVIGRLANGFGGIRSDWSNGPEGHVTATHVAPVQNFYAPGLAKTEGRGLPIGIQDGVRLLGVYFTSMTEIRANRTNCRTGMS